MEEIAKDDMNHTVMLFFLRGSLASTLGASLVKFRLYY